MKKGMKLIMISLLSGVMLLSACSAPNVGTTASVSATASVTATAMPTATEAVTATTAPTATAAVTVTAIATATPTATATATPIPTVIATATVGASATVAPQTTPDAGGATHVLMMSDVHLCHMSWNGHTSEYRMDKMVKDLNAFNKEDPYSNILFMGDYSLDFWQHGEGGSYVNEGISNTKRLKDEYLSRLDCQNYVMIPGNHEQYSNQKWKEITGNDRQTSLVIGGWLFILLDNFNADLDPKHHSDGTYTQTDVEYIKQEMAKHPDMPVILAAHYFDISKESDELKALVAGQERIVCLFSGHEHHNKNVRLSKDWGSKYVFNFGNYSYTKNVPVQRCMWGWRSLKLDSNGVTVSYYSPQSTIKVDGKDYTNTAGSVSSVYLANPLAE